MHGEHKVHLNTWVIQVVVKWVLVTFHEPVQIRLLSLILVYNSIFVVFINSNNPFPVSLYVFVESECYHFDSILLISYWVSYLFSIAAGNFFKNYGNAKQVVALSH